MEYISPHIAWFVSKYLTREECIHWSRVSKAVYALVSPTCYLRLTREQVEVVNRALALDDKEWKRVFEPNEAGQVNHETFPNDYIISTGTSTGKTVMSYVIASEYVRRGKKPLIIVDRKLFIQWVDEYNKFQEDMKLAPLTVINKEWDSNYDGSSILLMSKNIVNRVHQNFDNCESDIVKNFSFICQDLDLFIMDEKTPVPKFARQDFKGFGILLDASSKGWLGNAAVDPMLGKVPALHAHILIEPASHTYYPIDKFIDKYNTWCAKFRSGKTLVVSNDTCVRRNNVEKSESIFNQMEVEGATHSYRRGHGPDQRAKTLQDFVNSEEDALMTGNVSYIGKGFNIPCDTLIVIDLNGGISTKMIQQIIGRVRRVQTGISSVNLYFITSNTKSWKIIPSLTKNTTKEIIYTSENIGGVEAMKSMRVQIERTHLSKESYYVVIPPPSLPLMSFSDDNTSGDGDAGDADDDLPIEEEGFLGIPVDTECSYKGHDLRTYKNYSVTLLSSDSLCIMQVLINSQNVSFLWTRAFSYMGHRSIKLYRKMNLFQCIERFKELFIHYTGNDWSGLHRFVRQPGRHCLMGFHPQEISVKYGNCISVKSETLESPEPWTEESEFRLLNDHNMRENGWFRPDFIFPNTAREALTTNDSVSTARMKRQVEVLKKRVSNDPTVAFEDPQAKRVKYE